jgi:putative transposase
MFRNYRYLLRPTRQQERLLDFQLWQSRLIYNAALEERIKAYRETGKTFTAYEQSKRYRAMRYTYPDTVGQLSPHSINQTLRRLDKAYRTFFRQLKAGKKTSLPEYKTRKTFLSYEYSYGYGCRLVIDPGGRARLRLQNVGSLRMCYHRQISEDAKIKHVVIKFKNSRWWAFLMVEILENIPINRNLSAIGIDVGLRTLMTFSDGSKVENPHWMYKSQAHLRVLQRRGSRRKKGSKRRALAWRKVNKFYERVTNQRKDHYHKLTRQLVNQHSLVAIEDLPMAFMNQHAHLTYASYDASWGTFRRFLEYKASAAGVQVIAVTPYNTSQRCSGCGELVLKDLDTRVHACPHCGLVLDRDVNAARNILQAALSRVNAK